MKDLITLKGVFTAVYVAVVFLFAVYIVVLSAIFFSGGIYVEKSAQLGDTIGGMLGPIIGGVGALLTFFAFYVQYQANQDTKEQFRIQHQNSLEAGFETAFFARLELFKKVQKDVESVVKFKDLVEEYEFFDDYVRWLLEKDKICKTRSVLVKYVSLKNSGPLVVDPLNHLFNSKWTPLTYHRFVFDEAFLRVGNVTSTDLCTFDKSKSHTLATSINAIKFLTSNPVFQGGHAFYFKVDLPLSIDIHMHQSDRSFSGRSELVNPYFRNLYHLFKFVIESTAFDNMSISGTPSVPIDFVQKRNRLIMAKKMGYLRLIRAQMSNYETVFFYYNLLADIGEKWFEVSRFSNVNCSMVRDFNVFGNLNQSLVLPQYRIASLPLQLRQYFHVDQGGTWEGR